MKPKVKFVDWGLASNFGRFIEMHKDLPKYPDLYYPLLKHEFSHTDKLWTWHDFKIDYLESTKVNRWNLFYFMLKRPKTWIAVSPFYWCRKHGFVYDLNQVIFWGLMVAVFTTIWLIL